MAHMAFVVSSTLPTRRRLIRSVKRLSHAWLKRQSNVLSGLSNCWRRGTSRWSIAAAFPLRMCQRSCSAFGTTHSGQMMRSFAPSFRRASGLRCSGFIPSSSVCVGCFRMTHCRRLSSLFSRHTGCSFREQRPERCRLLFQHMTTSPNHALQRTRPSRHCCNRGASRAGALSLVR
ncbi:MAG: hypothetical protein JWO94_695 [Verrucomicrobiaceae bacterium]|nr:hypothetical protein [Verrucomicrobiaceae bacterium]